jgi:D-alanine-D-alanine ligase
MRIAILFDRASRPGAAPDLMIDATIAAVEQALAADGHVPLRVAATRGGAWERELRDGAIDLVFNLCEGIDGDAMGEPAVIERLESLGVPFTGASSRTAALCLRKPALNARLARAGLPVPPFARVARGDVAPDVGFPAICKPAAEDASLGIDQGSVVRTAGELALRLHAMHGRWSDVVVQRYVAGREMNVGIVGDEPLPISEISFARMPAGLWPIVTYESKWHAGSVEDAGATPVCPAELPGALAGELRRVALAAWRAAGGTGYGRVDFRVDELDRPWVLEVNANPDLAPDAGLARMACAAGLEYPALVRRICALALAERGSAGGEAYVDSASPTAVAGA